MGAVGKFLSVAPDFPSHKLVISWRPLCIQITLTILRMMFDHTTLRRCLAGLIGARVRLVCGIGLLPLVLDFHSRVSPPPAGDDWASCKKCHRQMHMILQVRRVVVQTTCASADRVLLQLHGELFDGFMFGDSGTAHLFQCTKHKTELAVRWACC